MDTQNEGVCFDCAMRLGKRTFPDIPELVMGYCPQCGGTLALELIHAHGDDALTGRPAAGRQQAA